MSISDLTPYRILITEDHHFMRKTLRGWLSKELSPVEILEASNAEDALALCKSQPLDLVLMDFHLPDMNGIEVTEQIKMACPALPVVILTVQESGQYKDKAVKAGVNAYVIKHQMYTDLIPAIKKLLRQENAPGEKSNHNQKKRTSPG